MTPPTPLSGASLQALNNLVSKLEKSGWDSDGDGTKDKGIIDVLFVGPGHPLQAELQAELNAAGLAMDEKTKKCVMGALEGLKKAAEGDQDGKDSDGKVKRKSRVVVDPSKKEPLEADTTPNEVQQKDGVTSQKHTAEKCTGQEHIQISTAGADALSSELGYMAPVLMHEGKRTCQVLEIPDTANLSVQQKATKKMLDCEASHTQILIWIALKLTTTVRTEPPPEQQPKSHRLACKMLEVAIKAKKDL